MLKAFLTDQLVLSCWFLKIIYLPFCWMTSQKGGKDPSKDQ